MSVEARKLELFQKLLKVREESLLKKVEDLLDEELIVAYTTDGVPLTIHALEKELKSGEEDIKSGRVYTTEEVRSRFKI